ncbi:unnamed protein product [Cyclocybe aegerita]|uniref:Uncharacterized protein n=1 Tax=Cyclocybe aegerita TaxID=1973307 RepID=A0A8S0XRL3_CYCAE|nr:unnamed protein product [Cyclocybe aegerita]
MVHLELELSIVVLALNPCTVSMATSVPVIVPPLNLPCKQPLPRNHYRPVNERLIHEAYDQCLQNELEAGNNERFLMWARCLGHLIREAPDTAARTGVAEEINRCNGSRAQMDLLAEFYVNHLIRLFRQDKVRTPTRSTHSSRSSSSDEQ